MKNFFHLLVINIITFLYCASIVLTMDPELCAALFDATVWQYIKCRIVLIWKQMLHVSRSFFWSRKRKGTHPTDVVVINGSYQTPDQPSEKQEGQEKFHPPAIIKRSQVAPIETPNFDTPINITVVSFTNSLCTKKIVAGFSNYCQKELGNTYNLKYYSAQRSKSKMRHILDYIDAYKHSLILAIGAVATACLKRKYEVSNLHTPVVFTAVKNPLELGIVNDYEKPGGYFTGVTGVGHDYKEQIDCLFAAKQTIKRILIPYTEYSPYIKDDIEFIKKMVESRRADIEYVGYKNPKEFDKHILGPLKEQSFDTIITLRDILQIPLLDALVGHANQYGITVYSSDTPSLSRGAGIAYGHPEESFGSNAGKHAFDILVQGYHPSEVPITQMKLENGFWINPNAAEQQGIKNAHTLASIMQKGKIFTNEHE